MSVTPFRPVEGLPRRRDDPRQLQRRVVADHHAGAEPGPRPESVGWPARDPRPAWPRPRRRSGSSCRPSRRRSRGPEDRGQGRHFRRVDRVADSLVAVEFRRLARRRRAGVGENSRFQPAAAAALAHGDGSRRRSGRPLRGEIRQCSATRSALSPW